MNDADLARDVLDELLWDDSIDSSRINVTADDGKVVITGIVNTFYEKWAAGQAAWRIYGVRDVQDDIVVDANNVKVRDVGGVVTLTGTVRSMAEAQEAEHAAWLAPGVTAVYDELAITG